MRIGTRIALGFATAVALTLGVGVYSLEEHGRYQELATDMRDRDLRIVEGVARARQIHTEMRMHRELALAAFLATRRNGPNSETVRSQQDWREAYRHNQALLRSLRESVNRFAALARSQKRVEGWRRIGDKLEEVAVILERELAPGVQQRFDAIAAGGEAAAPVVDELDRAGESYDRALKEAEGFASEQVDLGSAEALASYERARSSILLALLISLVVAVGCSVAIRRSVTAPLAKFQDLATRVGGGDLTVRAEAGRADEMGEMGGSLNAMIEGLGEVAQQARSAAQSLSAATSQIQASTQQQAASTAQQAAAVQETTATLAEISQSGAQITERAKSVAAAAEATSSASEAGRQAAQEAARIMESIREQAEAVADHVILLSERTQTIGEIIATVNDIAEQSHLLALNAAIEAASAGEHGRGFSVVASEIKNLADQSKEATVQVRSILGEIQKGINSSVMLTEEAVKRVGAGKKQAELTDATIGELAAGVERSIQAFQQIAAGANQQQIGLDQIAKAVRDIGQASAQTASGTQQLEQAAVNVNEMAQQLRGAVERYRL